MNRLADLLKNVKTVKTGLLVLCLVAGGAQAQQQCPYPLTTPDSDFSDGGNGTVLHIPTGLIWKRCLEGPFGGTWTPNAPSKCTYGGTEIPLSIFGDTWEQALARVDAINAGAAGTDNAGHTDWRLPNIRELRSIIELGCDGGGSSNINLAQFVSPSSVVWSNTPIMREFFGVAGSVGTSDRHGVVRLVRGGKDYADFDTKTGSSTSGPLLRDAIYLYGRSFNGYMPPNDPRTDRLVGVNCDVLQLELNVESGNTDLRMGLGNTLEEAGSNATLYRDSIVAAAPMFAYALYGNQPVKSFEFADRNLAKYAQPTGTGTAFAYCYSSRPDAHVYFADSNPCLKRYSDGSTKSCTVADNGSTSTATNNLVLRDAIYLYDQTLNSTGDKTLVGENCDAFQLVMNVTGGYTDFAHAEADSYENAVKLQANYPDRIAAGKMFSYSLYSSQPVKTFTFKDKNASGAASNTGTATVFGYCYSAQANARVSFRERDKCTRRLSNGQVETLTPCTP